MASAVALTRRPRWPRISCLAALPQVSAWSSAPSFRGRLNLQDRRQYPAGIAGPGRTGQEAGDLGTERVAVPAGREPQRMVARLLEIASAGDVRGQVATVAPVA